MALCGAAACTGSSASAAWPTAREVARAGPAGQQQAVFPADEDFPLRRERGPGQGQVRRVASGSHNLVDTPKLQAFLKELKQQTPVLPSTWSDCLSPLQCDIVGYAIAWKPAEALYLAVLARTTPRCSTRRHVGSEAPPVLEDPRVAKVNQNIKFDLLVLGRRASDAGRQRRLDGGRLPSLHAGERSHSLDVLSLTT